MHLDILLSAINHQNEHIEFLMTFHLETLQNFQTIFCIEKFVQHYSNLFNRDLIEKVWITFFQIIEQNFFFNIDIQFYVECRTEYVFKPLPRYLCLNVMHIFIVKDWI
jgi:hypothetical protein